MGTLARLVYSVTSTAFTVNVEVERIIYIFIFAVNCFVCIFLYFQQLTHDTVPHDSGYRGMTSALVG